MKTAFIFDHDGTLVDSESAHAEIWKKILKRYSVDFSRDEYFGGYSGFPVSANAEALALRYSLDVAPEDLAREKTLAAHEDLRLGAFPLNSFVREALELLAERGIRMAIVTGAGRYALENTLLSYGIEFFFDVTVCGDDVSAAKPAPDGYLLALKKLGLPASECIAVEDSENGRRAAEAAGIECLLYRDDAEILRAIRRYSGKDS